MRELQNNWNSLQFAFEHLMVDKNDEKKKNENNNIKKEKVEKSTEKETSDSEENEEREEEEELTTPEVVSPRRSPRVRRSSSRASESASGRSTPTQPAQAKRSRKMEKRVERRRNNSELNRQNSSETNSTDIEIVPKRESLRRVLELSKQEYENKNKKSTDETDESDNDDISDEETDSKVKTEPKIEPIEETEIVGDIETRKTPKKVPIMPKVNVEADVKTLEIETPVTPTPTPLNASLNVSATTITPSPSPIKKRPRAKEPKTDPKILARQRELYHKRKERQKNDPNFGKKDKLVKMVKLDQQAPEKGKPWSKIQERKTPPQILEKRKRQYHEKRLKEKQQQLTQQTTPSKSLQKIEPASKTVTTNRIAITPTKASHKSFSFVTVVPPVVTSEQYKTFQSLSELNEHPTLLVLPTAATGTSPSSSIITKSVIAGPFKPQLDTKSPNGHPRLPKKRNWSLKEANGGVIVGSTNGTSLPGNKESERTTSTDDQRKTSTSSDSSSSRDGKYMRKKVLAKHWVEENSTDKEKLDPGDQKEDNVEKSTAATTPPPPTQKSPTPPPPQQTTPKPTQEQTNKTPTSANHILKNRLTQAPLPVE